MAIKVYGSNGEFNIDSHGHIIDKQSIPEEYRHFNRFNLNEYVNWLYRNGIPYDDNQLDIDILDIGVWHGRFNMYESPDDDHRNEWAMEYHKSIQLKQNDSRNKALNEILDSYHTGQLKQMVELIDAYGLYDVWDELLAFIKDTYGEVIDMESNHTFQQMVIAYHKIKFR